MIGLPTIHPTQPISQSPSGPELDDDVEEEEAALDDDIEEPELDDDIEEEPMAGADDDIEEEEVCGTGVCVCDVTCVCIPMDRSIWLTWS